MGYKGLVFVEIIDGKHGQGTHITKIAADKLAENTPNAPKFIGPNCLLKPKSLGFQWKKASWASVARELPVTIQNKWFRQMKKQTMIQ